AGPAWSAVLVGPPSPGCSDRAHSGRPADGPHSPSAARTINLLEKGPDRRARLGPGWPRDQPQADRPEILAPEIRRQEAVLAPEHAVGRLLVDRLIHVIDSQVHPELRAGSRGPDPRTVLRVDQVQGDLELDDVPVPGAARTDLPECVADLGSPRET